MAETKTTKPKVTPEQRKAQAAANFVRLANKRGNKVLTAVDALGRLAAPNYQYTPEQVTDLFGALADAIRAAEAKFSQPTKVARADAVLVK